MAAERFDELPALAEIRAALERETQTLRAAGTTASSPRRHRSRRRLRALPVLAGVAVPIVVLAVALLVLHGGGSSPHAATSADRIPGRQALIDELAVLRRPQTQADLPAFLTLLRVGAFARGAVDSSLVRYATTTPWGERIYLVPFRPLTAAELARFQRTLHLPAFVIHRLRARGETVGAFSYGGGGGAATAQQIAATGTGGSRSDSSGTEFVEVVPDGVASVTFIVARQPETRVPSTPKYRASRSITVPVSGNVAAVQFRHVGPPVEPALIWRDAGGRVIKRIDNLGGLNRIVAAGAAAIRAKAGRLRRPSRRRRAGAAAPRRAQRPASPRPAGRRG